MKELMENVTDPDLTGDVENSTFVINDCTFKIQELFKFANETSEKVEKRNDVQISLNCKRSKRLKTCSSASKS